VLIEEIIFYSFKDKYHDQITPINIQIYAKRTEIFLGNRQRNIHRME